jgi:hypothetical protein
MKRRRLRVVNAEASTATPRKRGATLPTRFTPQFWADADRRHAVVRRVEELVERLKVDSSCDSAMKDILCQRAAFLAIVLETAEREAIETGEFDGGSYTQTCNGLVGMLRAIGLERRVKAVGLQDYLGKRA